VFWILSVLVLAAVLSPWVYQAGKNFALSAADGDSSGLGGWLAAACGRAKFSRYFSRCFSISALLLLPFLLKRISKVRARDGVAAAVRIKLPWKTAALQIALGCLIAGGILWGTGLILEQLGAYAAEPKPTPLAKLLPRILLPAIAAPLLEEWIFRGLLLGLWLRYTQPLAACVGTSLFFAFVHFLSPPEGSEIANPAAAGAGFELLGKILLHFTDPTFFVTDFATLFVVGMILAWARLRTGALWFSIGLHAGWVAAFKGFSILHFLVEGHPLRPWGIGDSLRSGLVPMLALGLTAAVCHFTLRFLETARAQPRITVTTTTF